MPDEWLKRLQAGDAAEHESDGYAGTILTRPGLYTFNSTLEEVLCYLDGYYDRMTHDERAGSEMAQREYWDFLRWLRDRLPGPLGSHQDLVRSLRGRFPEDSAALAYLAEEYRGYCSSLGNEGPSAP